MENKYEKVKAIMPDMMFAALGLDGTIDTAPSFGIRGDNNIIILCGIVREKGFFTFEEITKMQECGEIIGATGIHIQGDSSRSCVELYYRVTPAEIIEQELKNLEIRSDRLKLIIPIIKSVPNAEWRGGNHVWVKEIPEDLIAFKTDENTVTLKDGNIWKNAAIIGADKAGWVCVFAGYKEV